jgi:flagellar basal body-associated protein FliL
MDDQQNAPKRDALRMVLGPAVVLIGVAAIVIALVLVLDHYPVQAANADQAGTDRSSAVVAVLTPVAAAIAGIVGLYFGISATGSARGQQAQQAAHLAAATSNATEAVKIASQTVQSASVPREHVTVPEARQTSPPPGGRPT